MAVFDEIEPPVDYEGGFGNTSEEKIFFGGEALLDI